MAWNDAERQGWFGDPFGPGETDWINYGAYFAGLKDTLSWMQSCQPDQRLAIRKALFLAAQWMPNAVHLVRDDMRAIIVESKPKGRSINWAGGSNKLAVCRGDAIAEGIVVGDSTELFFGISPVQGHYGPFRHLQKNGGDVVGKSDWEFFPISAVLTAQENGELANRIKRMNPPEDQSEGVDDKLVPSRGEAVSGGTAPTPDPHQEPKMQLNTILYGPPGTGKTLATLGLALSLFQREKPVLKVTEFASGTLGEEYAAPPTEEWAKWVTNYDQLVTEGRIAFTTFHQNYAYEDFVEGIRAETKADGENGPTSVSYSVQDGIFKGIAYRALYAWLTGEPYPVSSTSEAAARETVEVWLQSGKFPSTEQAQANDDNAPPYLLIIDEINRGNMARILGELITLLEDSKRARREPVLGQQPLKAILPYTRKPFIVPPNLYILGTMNTADRSLIGLDVALRRRFSFVELPPRPEALPEDVEGVRLRAFLEELNRRIAEVLDSDHLIGHAFLAGVTTLQGLGDAMRQKVIPQLREYFHDRPQDLFEVLKTADGATCEFLIFEGSGRNQKLKGIRAENLDIANTYNRLLRNDPAANAANQAA